MNERFLKFDKTSPPLGVDRRGVYRGAGAIDLVIDVKNKTYTCDMAPSELFEKIKAEGWGVCNLRLNSTSSDSTPGFICPYQVGSYMPYWIKAYYFSVEFSASGNGMYIKPYEVKLDSDGNVTITQNGTFTGEQV